MGEMIITKFEIAAINTSTELSIMMRGKVLGTMAVLARRNLEVNIHIMLNMLSLIPLGEKF